VPGRRLYRRQSFCQTLTMFVNMNSTRLSHLSRPSYRKFPGSTASLMLKSGKHRSKKSLQNSISSGEGSEDLPFLDPGAEGLTFRAECPHENFLFAWHPEAFLQDIEQVFSTLNSRKIIPLNCKSTTEAMNEMVTVTYRSGTEDGINPTTIRTSISRKRTPCAQSRMTSFDHRTKLVNTLFSSEGRGILSLLNAIDFISHAIFLPSVDII